jgi:glycosyltransferase involved in cell wall biosynthesis
MQKQSKANIDLSVIIPILNERDNLTELHQQLTIVLSHLKRTYEIVFVDDGSTDGSLQLCRKLTTMSPHVVLVELRRNFGKATALQVGFQVARGKAIITMDGDLQDDVKEIPHFLEALEEGLDLVSGWKQNRQDPLHKTLPSRLFNWVTSFLTGIPLRDFNCGFKAYRREVIESLNLYGELHRYIPVLAHAKGFRVGEIPVYHHPRRHGKSKYSFERFFRGAFDLLTTLFLCGFQRRPLHLFGLVGLAFLLIGVSIDAYLAFLWFAGIAYIGNRPLLMLGTLLIIVGIQILIFGLLAELITAATYRRSEALEYVRHIHQTPEPSGKLTSGQRPDDG